MSLNIRHELFLKTLHFEVFFTTNHFHTPMFLDLHHKLLLIPTLPACSLSKMAASFPLPLESSPLINAQARSNDYWVFLHLLFINFIIHRFCCLSLWRIIIFSSSPSSTSSPLSCWSPSSTYSPPITPRFTCVKQPHYQRIVGTLYFLNSMIPSPLPPTWTSPTSNRLGDQLPLSLSNPSI